MTASVDSLTCRGMRDLLPEEMERFRRVEHVFRSTCEAWGFREIRTPVIEHLHLFTSAGTLSPRMLGRVYSFLDWDGWSGERVVLRPDATIPVTRLYREHLGLEVGKLFYVENMFRFASGDEPRELWQCGAESIGDTWPLGDVEVISVARAVLRRLGFAEVLVHLSHTGIMRALLASAGYTPDEQLVRYDRILDGDFSFLGEIEQRLPGLGAPLQPLFALGGGNGFIENLRSVLAPSVPAVVAPLDELAIVAQTLAGAGCPFVLDLAMVRDFEYYSGPVFHLTVDGEELAGGGRYDGLATDRAGAPLPACGFAIGVERVLGALPAVNSGRELRTVQVRPAAISADAMALAVMVSSELQENGFCAELIAPNRAPACRWRLTVDARSGESRYRLEDCIRGAELCAGSMEQILPALERGRTQ
jgi:histidyl-tRNA synthetase